MILPNFLCGRTSRIRISLSEDRRFICGISLAAVNYDHDEIDLSGSLPCAAQIDTGANTSCIPRQKAVDLGLDPVRESTAKTAAGPVSFPVYLVDIIIPLRNNYHTTNQGVHQANKIYRNLRVIGLPEGKNDALIGMDILRDTNFFYRKGKLTIDF